MKSPASPDPNRWVAPQGGAGVDELPEETLLVDRVDVAGPGVQRCETRQRSMQIVESSSVGPREPATVSEQLGP